MRDPEERTTAYVGEINQHKGLPGRRLYREA